MTDLLDSGGEYYYYSHFTKEEIGVPEGEKASGPGPKVSENIQEACLAPEAGSGPFSQAQR